MFPSLFWGIDFGGMGTGRLGGGWGGSLAFALRIGPWFFPGGGRDVSAAGR